MKLTLIGLIHSVFFSLHRLITYYYCKMADAAPVRGGFRGGFGSRDGHGGRGGRGHGRGRRRDGRGDKEDSKQWVPVTKLGRLVRDVKINSLEEIYLYALPIKELEIIGFFLGSALRDEVLKIIPIQKKTSAGQRTRFMAFVAILAWVSNAARMLPPLFVLPSSWPSFRLFPFVVVTGATRSVNPIQCPARSLASAVSVRCV